MLDLQAEILTAHSPFIRKRLFRIGVLADEFDKSHPADRRFDPSVAALLDDAEILRISGTDGQDDPPAIGKLLAPGDGHVRGGCPGDDA